MPVSQTIEHYPLNQTNQDITRVSNNTSSNNITSAQTNTTNVNGLKGTDQTIDVGQAGTSQGQNLSVSDSGQTAQGTDAQTTSQNPDISQTTQNNDVTVSTSQVDVADAQKAQGQDLVSAQPNAVQSDIQVSDLNQDTANTQAKTIRHKFQFWSNCKVKRQNRCLRHPQRIKQMHQTKLEQASSLKSVRSTIASLKLQIMPYTVWVLTAKLAI